MPSRVLDVTKARASIQAEGHEGVPKIVRMQACCLARHCHDCKSTKIAPYGWLVESSTSRGSKQRAGRSSVQVCVNCVRGSRGERNCRVSSPLPRDSQHSVAPLGVEIRRICAESLPDTQTVQREQKDDGMSSRAVFASGRAGNVGDGGCLG